MKPLSEKNASMNFVAPGESAIASATSAKKTIVETTEMIVLRAASCGAPARVLAAEPPGSRGTVADHGH